MGREFDEDYINHCMDDLNKINDFLSFMSYENYDSGKIDCIIELLKDYKRFER